MDAAGAVETAAGGRRRTLGRSGIEVSGLGLGCWTIGGPTHGPDGRTMSWGAIDDDASH